MNIKITFDWILDYLETDCDAYNFSKYISLCGPSFEKVEKTNNDFIFDVEITPNRVDCASAFGIAQEARAILPNFNIKANIKNNPFEKYLFPETTRKEDEINIKIADSDLCSRFTAVVLDNIKIEKSPDFISKRLALCGIKSINNVVDISNYIMLSIGQPSHIFDYEKIKDHKMIMRKSKKGEKIQILDKSIISLQGDDIVIEDGSGKLIDLCGIMGGLSSSVSDKTSKIILFIQTYNKQKIRRTSMRTGIRTVAATYFEKGLDEERVEIGIGMGIELLEKYADGKVSSKIYDIYSSPVKQRSIIHSVEKTNKLIGINIDKEKQLRILDSLGFKVNRKNFSVTVPFWRTNDIKEQYDLIEEVARIYGYFNLPSQLQPFSHTISQKNIEDIFRISSKIKIMLKNIGFHENINYSMISKTLINDFSEDPKKFLKISNPISKDLEYLRTSIIPSLIMNIKKNEGKREFLRFFEVSKIFNKNVDNLPNEIYKLGIVTNTSFFDIKGAVESLMDGLNIHNIKFAHSSDFLIADKQQAKIIINNEVSGFIGRLKPSITQRLKIQRNVYICEIDLIKIIKNYKHLPKYKKPLQFAVIKLDLTAKIKNFEDFKKKSFEISKELINLKVIDTYKDNVTLRLYFSSPYKNLTEQEAKKEIEKIKSLIQK
jgi:phenylalanyl-tRNA synthetase beta chain